MITIVMYHYVRDLPRTRYPLIKGLLPANFVGQLAYIYRHYTVCGTRQLIAALQGKEPLPPNPCLLTFDDGFIDHYLTVFPLLRERGMVASFYPAGMTIAEHRVLDVHKVHFILASVRDFGTLVAAIRELLRQYRARVDLPSDETLFASYAKPGRYDGPEVMFVKGVLQRGLPTKVRSEMIDTLFRRFVTEHEEAFARELYMDLPQLRCMLRNGMEIGGHGYSHSWLEHLPKNEQEEEVGRTRDFLATIFENTPVDWVMCYPYGSYNEETISALRESGCVLGLTTRVGLIHDLSRPFELMRLDANDLPFDGHAEPCSWTVQAKQGSYAFTPHSRS